MTLSPVPSNRVPFGASVVGQLPVELLSEILAMASPQTSSDILDTASSHTSAFKTCKLFWHLLKNGTVPRIYLTHFLAKGFYNNHVKNIVRIKKIETTDPKDKEIIHVEEIIDGHPTPSDMKKFIDRVYRSMPPASQSKELDCALATQQLTSSKMVDIKNSGAFDYGDTINRYGREFILNAVRIDGNFLWRIPADQITEVIAREAVKKNSEAIKYVPPTVQNYSKIAHIATEQDARNTVHVHLNVLTSEMVWNFFQVCGPAFA